MGKALDLMERAFESILNNWSLIYDEAFMMDSIFAEISDTVDPFREYLTYMSEEKGGYRVDGNQDDKVNQWMRYVQLYFIPPMQILCRQMISVLSLELFVPWLF